MILILINIVASSKKDLIRVGLDLMLVSKQLAAFATCGAMCGIRWADPHCTGVVGPLPGRRVATEGPRTENGTLGWF